ncbi:MAG: hypothetical protein WD063_21430 [Pirellulales bacterium]
MLTVTTRSDRACTTPEEFRTTAYWFALVLAAALISGVAATRNVLAVPVLTFNEATGGSGTNQDQSVGWQFDVLNPITVVGLGWFDEGANGLGRSHTVGIWNPAGTLLDSVLIPAGVAAPLDGQFRTIAIAPLVLAPGAGYIVGGENFSNSGDRLADDVTQVVDSRIGYIDATFSTIGSGFVRPTSFSVATTGFYGVSFSTPEPSGIALGAMALGALVGFVRRLARRTAGRPR